ncbi:MAG: DUF1824 family protein [Leptolyngbyaceae cyanobacterium]
MTFETDCLTLDQAQVLLRRFTLIDLIQPDQLPDCHQIQAALSQIQAHSDYQIFGICADTVEQAAEALTAYLQAFDYDGAPALPVLPGPVYVKYNPKTGRSHVDNYTGSDRGVLVSCQSAYDRDVNETFGYLPLDLFQSS